MSGPVIGIDLGTLYSCVAVVRDGKAVVLSDEGRSTIPSCVALQGERELMGEAARRNAVTDPQSTIIAVKRLLGHPFDSDDVRRAAERLPYALQPSPLGSVLLDVGGRQLTPVQISARILQRVREVAEQALGEAVSRAVVAVPAHFNDVQRKATKLAAEYAGLEVLRLINEPTAAAFAYGYKKAKDFSLAVYDLGGGTFDVTVMQARGDCFSVVATDGDPFLGGEDVDAAVAEWLEQEFQGEFDCDLSGDLSARRRLAEAAEKAKIELTDVATAQIEVPFLTRLPDGERPGLTRSLTREKLAELSQPLIARTLELCARCLETAELSPGSIDEVLLVGGQSRMLAVREAVREFFDREPRRDINPDEVVAMGTALYGYSLVADELKGSAEHAVGEAWAVARKETEVARRLVHEVERFRENKKKAVGDEKLASRLDELLKATGEDEGDPPTDSATDTDLPRLLDNLPEKLDGLQLEVEQLRDKAGSVLDELVSDLTCSTDGFSEILNQTREAIDERLEAAREASGDVGAHAEEAAEHGNARKVTLKDVTSLPLGIASAGDVFTRLIEQNEHVPTEYQRVFTTNQDGQAEVEIRVFQGRESRASDNQFLGSFILQGIAPAARMTPRIEVAFRIDEDGILAVAAHDADSGARQDMRVEDPLGLQEAPEGDGDGDAERISDVGDNDNGDDVVDDDCSDEFVDEIIADLAEDV